MFVVCRNKKDNSLFITTRGAREVMLKGCSMVGDIPDSNVIKTCNTYQEADHFKQEQQRINKELNNLLKNNQ